jgi:hypothetical protein
MFDIVLETLITLLSDGLQGLCCRWTLICALRYHVPFVSFMTLCAPLWIKLCDHFVPLCAFVIILCDILKFYLIG